jgi:CHAD domain-containing protein
LLQSGALASDPVAIAGVPAAPPRRSTRGAKLKLRRGVPLRDAILSAFRGIVLSARRHARAAEENPEQAVHEYRKSIRRARSVLALLRPSLGRTATRGMTEELRRAFRDTGLLRDRDVLVRTLSGLAGDDPVLFVEAAEFAARLSEGPDRPAPAEVLKGAAPIVKPLPAALEVTMPREYSTPDLERGLTRSFRRTRQALARAVETRADADFHEWRKRVKELRYQVELLASSGSRMLKRREKALGELARELGSVTDISVLCRELEALAQPAPDGHGAKLLERGRQLVRQRSDELLTRGAELFAEEPRAFALRVLAERG